MSPEGLALIGPLALETIRQAHWEMDAIGGLTLGADPVSYAIAYASATTSKPLRAFTIRKEPKAYGTERLIEGPFHTGDSVVVIEDVVTTGGSALRAAAAIQAAGGIITGVLTVVDRDEGGREALLAAGFPLIALVRATEIIARLHLT